MARVTDDLVQLYTESDGLRLGELVRGGEVRADELVETAFTAIDRINPKLNAVVHRLEEMARAQIVAGVRMNAPFAGVPYLLLASMWEGAPLTNSCAWPTQVRAPADSEAVRRTKAAGFVLVGNTPALTQKSRPLGYWSMNEGNLDRCNAKWTGAVFMFPFNIAGLPAMSLPLYWSADGLPVGVQLVGRYGDEATILAMATVLEQEMPWRHRRPPLHAATAA